jgi:hypothetical protein
MTVSEIVFFAWGVASMAKLAKKSTRLAISE